MRKKQELSLLLALLFTAIFGVAFAGAVTKERVGVGFLLLEHISGSVAIATDYPFHGISQTGEDPAIRSR